MAFERTTKLDDVLEAVSRGKTTVGDRGRAERRNVVRRFKIVRHFMLNCRVLLVTFTMLQRVGNDGFENEDKRKPPKPNNTTIN